MSDWKVWKSERTGLWWALEQAPHPGHVESCDCRSFNGWHDAMSYVKGYLGGAA
jgi:hypothetical protein